MHDDYYFMKLIIYGDNHILLNNINRHLIWSGCCYIHTYAHIYYISSNQNASATLDMKHVIDIFYDVISRCTWGVQKDRTF